MQTLGFAALLFVFMFLLSFRFFMGFGGLRTSRPLLASFCTTGSVDAFPTSQRHQRRTRKSRTRNRRSRRSQKQWRPTRLPHQPQRRHQGFPRHKPWLRFPVRTSLMRRQVAHHTACLCTSQIPTLNGCWQFLSCCIVFILLIPVFCWWPFLSYEQSTSAFIVDLFLSLFNV